jgi:hypothetical protein
MRTDRQMDTTKLVVAFRNFANAPTYRPELLVVWTLCVIQLRITMKKDELNGWWPAESETALWNMKLTRIVRKIQISWKSVKWEPSSIRTDKNAGRRDKADSRFS